MLLFVHLLDTLANLTFGELAHAVAEHLFLFGKRRQRTR
jgi:hypothetical protein